MAEDKMTNGAGHPTANLGGAGSGGLPPAIRARNKMVTGAVLLAIGMIGVGLGGLGMIAVTDADFPGARLIGLFILLFFVVAAVVAVRGFVWLIQGLIAVARPPK
jgi:hypothetical protein